jgi:hypothetical protein
MCVGQRVLLHPPTDSRSVQAPTCWRSAGVGRISKSRRRLVVTRVSEGAAGLRVYVHRSWLPHVKDQTFSSESLSLYSVAQAVCHKIQAHLSSDLTHRTSLRPPPRYRPDSFVSPGSETKARLLSFGCEVPYVAQRDFVLHTSHPLRSRLVKLTPILMEEEQSSLRAVRPERRE